MTDSTRIPIPGTWNFRPAGATVDVAILAPGRLFRSDAIDALGDIGRAELVSLGVTTVVDLRSAEEVAAHPDDIAGSAMDGLTVPIFTGSAADYASLDPSAFGLATVYGIMTSRSGDTIAAALRAVAGAPGASLVHCTAGKDRTGVVVALALTVAGATRDEIAADYAQSEGFLAGEWADRFRVRAQVYGWTIEPGPAEELAFRSPESAIRGILAELEERHGSIDAYLDEIGFDESDRAALRTTLATPIAETAVAAPVD
ncbi:tyrosine-protein phosphatase [Microbacterium sp. ASV49]|uniref:Tyrosine-protein phosphatase n=1 Tax=Microbacterium candidum TaxID=3041922 RepID=A0ABT7MVM8_9MICO|nr:tyrosine-protein phosphatase [Microbacterium sp. ASV49]MDL9978497.1 tyrosine-protein phosphatase [Microbacterium sp. ASV49]